MTELKTANKVRFVIDVNRSSLKVYNKAAYVIPIIYENGTYRTGQDLTVQQMMKIEVGGGQYKEPESLSPEERKKYPFVIDPSKSYKARHLDWLKRDDPYQKAIIDLLLIGGTCAPTKAQFEENPNKYIGYLEDVVGEAIVENSKSHLRFEAESALRLEAGLDDYKRIALMFSFTNPEIDINTKAPQEVLFGQLVDLCETHPKQMKLCFGKYNPGIDKDIFILECIDENIIQRKDKGDLYYETDYIGHTLEDVKRFLGTRERETLYAKWSALLSQKKGISVVSSDDVNKRKENADYIIDCKLAIFDKDLERAELAFVKIKKELNPVEYDDLKVRIGEMKTSMKDTKEVHLIEKFREELKEQTIESLQKTISHAKSNYVVDDCKAFWDDKDGLVEYMVKIKFAKQQ